MKKRHCFYLPAFLLAFLWLLVLTDCTLHYKENENKPAAGHVLEFGTLKPIPEAVVTLYKCEGEVFGSFSCSSLDSTHSNSEGQYAFSQTGFLANARKAGYFTDFTTEKNVLFGTEGQTDIILPPYAWLQVTIRNESGAYAFFTDENSSDFPPVLLEQGQDSTLAVKLKRGNDITSYIFSVKTEVNDQFPDQTYWKNVKAFANGTPIDVTVGVGAFLNFYLPGHDTTHVTITY